MDWTKTIALTGIIACLGACGSDVATNGSGGSTTGSSTGTSTDSVPATTVTGSGPGCPAEAPRGYTKCPTLGLTCTYTTSSCALRFTCQAFSPSDPTADPWDCKPALAWTGPDAAGCDGCVGGAGCVACDAANQGDPCDVVGMACLAPGGGNCDNEARCTSDHTWSIESQAGCCI